jgi:hypothetical protein
VCLVRLEVSPVRGGGKSAAAHLPRWGSDEVWGGAGQHAGIRAQGGPRLGARVVERPRERAQARAQRWWRSSGACEGEHRGFFYWWESGGAAPSLCLKANGREREGDPIAARRAGEPDDGRRNRGTTWCGGVFHASWSARVCGGQVRRVLAVQAAGGARTPRGTVAPCGGARARPRARVFHSVYPCLTEICSKISNQTSKTLNSKVVEQLQEIIFCKG